MVREDVNALLFDEPLTVIDPHMKWELRTQLKSLHHDFGHTMIYVTHDQTEALTFADKVVVMYDGRVVQIGTPQELFERPAHTFVGYFIGSPGMNVFDAQVDGQGRACAGTKIDWAKAYAAGRQSRTGRAARIHPLSASGMGFPSRSSASKTWAATRLSALMSAAPRSTPCGRRRERSPDMNRVAFDPAGINVYADDWRVAPKGGLT